MTNGLWLTLTFTDADAATDWLRAIGFSEHAAWRDESDPSTVGHAEML